MVDNQTAVVFVMLPCTLPFRVSCARMNNARSIARNVASHQTTGHPCARPGSFAPGRAGFVGQSQMQNGFPFARRTILPLRQWRNDMKKMHLPTRQGFLLAMGQKFRILAFLTARKKVQHSVAGAFHWAAHHGGRGSSDEVASSPRNIPTFGLAKNVSRGFLF